MADRARPAPVLIVLGRTITTAAARLGLPPLFGPHLDVTGVPLGRFRWGELVELHPSAATDAVSIYVAPKLTRLDSAVHVRAADIPEAGACYVRAWHQLWRSGRYRYRLDVGLGPLRAGQWRQRAVVVVDGGQDRRTIWVRRHRGALQGRLGRDEIILRRFTVDGDRFVEHRCTDADLPPAFPQPHDRPAASEGPPPAAR